MRLKKPKVGDCLITNEQFRSLIELLSSSKIPCNIRLLPVGLDTTELRLSMANIKVCGDEDLCIDTFFQALQHRDPYHIYLLDERTT